MDEYDSDATVDTNVADELDVSMFLDVSGHGLFLKTKITWDASYKVFSDEASWAWRKNFMNTTKDYLQLMDFDAAARKNFDGLPCSRLLLHRVQQWHALETRSSSMKDFVLQHGSDHYFWLDIFPDTVNVIVDKLGGGHEVYRLGAGGSGDAQWCYWDADNKIYVHMERHSKGVVHPLRSMEFSPLAQPTQETCKCHGDEVCYIDQHFFAKADAFCAGRTNLLAGVPQGMKTQQALGAMAIAHFENGFLPVLVTRNITCDAKETWASSIKSFNSRVPEELRIVPYYETLPLERHIKENMEGIPALVVLYNTSGIKKIRELWERQLVSAIGRRYRAFHLVIDEADITVQTSSASSTTERTLWSGGKNSIFNTAAMVTWVTATPIALFINPAHMGTRLEEEVRCYGLDVVDQYYRFDEQNLGDVTGRLIRYADFNPFLANIENIVMGDMMASSGARRCLVTSSDMATKASQLTTSRRIAGMYDAEVSRAPNFVKTVVAIAWQSNTVTVFFGGREAAAFRSAFQASSGAKGVASDGLVLKGNINTVYNILFSLFGSDDESDGPDIVVVAKDMADRGVRLETSDHRWILTDLFIDKMTAAWSIESIVQIIGRINGVSKMDVDKCVWLLPANLDKVRAALMINSMFMKVLVADGYRRFCEFQRSSFEGIMGVLQMENPTMTTGQRAFARASIENLKASRMAACTKSTGQLKRHREDVEKSVKRMKLDTAVIQMEKVRQDLIKSTNPDNVAKDAEGYIPVLSSEAGFIQIWKDPATENIFKDISSHFAAARRVVGAEKLVPFLMKTGIFKSKAKAREFIRIGAKNLDMVGWMGKTGKTGAWMTTGGRGWTFLGTFGGDAGTAISGDHISQASKMRFEKEILEVIGQYDIGTLIQRSVIMAGLERVGIDQLEQQRFDLSNVLAKLVRKGAIRPTKRVDGEYQVMSLI